VLSVTGTASLTIEPAPVPIQHASGGGIRGDPFHSVTRGRAFAQCHAGGRTGTRSALSVCDHQPHHPYTVGLLGSVPASAGSAVRSRLRPIPGLPPNLIDLPPGCPFHPRCRYAMDVCRVEEPALRPVHGGPTHRSACWLPPDAAGMSPFAEQMRLTAGPPRPGRAA
jgi:oligopeptide/dipeptide ABC transporter ATP-binding protein